MPLLTADRLMELLDIQDNALRPLINANILSFQNWIAQELNNYFHTDDDILNSTLSFSGKVISDSNSGFVTAGFTTDMDIHIEGSKRNDGIYRVGTVAAATLTLDSNVHDNDFATEAASNSIYITRIAWPVGMELSAAKAIEIDIAKTRGIVEASTTLDDLGKYPEGLLKRFEPWRKWGLQSVPTPIRVRGQIINF